MDASSRARKVPVTLLTGFLGAGKTARLNATLKEGKSRIAVIENEIGALGVDGALVANSHAEADGVIELANGCLCCSAEVDLIAAFEALVRRHHLRPLDRIVVETTGLADLGPVISILEDSTDPLSEDLYLDGVVTVVDVCSFQRWASGGRLRAFQSLEERLPCRHGLLGKNSTGPVALAPPKLKPRRESGGTGFAEIGPGMLAACQKALGRCLLTEAWPSGVSACRGDFVFSTKVDQQFHFPAELQVSSCDLPGLEDPVAPTS
ncbi:unnamed protein product [Effrenium voratum]|nr:unnamed protein product [Effrenium voratum]